MKQTKHQVLDHGFIRYIDHMGGDLSIVRNARVSYDAAWRAGEDKNSDTRLIRYLMRNNHNTPFESGVVTFEVKAPIFVFRQWHRYRTQSYNELSARYRELPEEYFVPACNQITLQSADNKQMRSNDLHPRGPDIQNTIIQRAQDAFHDYKVMLGWGAPRELARSVLPVGTYSHMFATANLHNWYRFLKERLHPHAQKEIRVYAEKILMILGELFPVATEAFLEAERDQELAQQKAKMFDEAMNRFLETAKFATQEHHVEALAFAEICAKQLTKIEKRWTLEQKTSSEN